ncbi:uncharacterized protein G2W53_014518 [Senna tora]|uniref:Uncharacterized protein n=1 Tax=Senna tora TaxID=362788 RepID=A0A835C5S8_9FABA|nr:uncharacterized protein G2W53_014518 [Senna tora]
MAQRGTPSLSLTLKLSEARRTSTNLLHSLEQGKNWDVLKSTNMIFYRFFFIDTIQRRWQ